MPKEIWNISDLSRNVKPRPYTRDAINKALAKGTAPEPDFTTGAGAKYWLPETITPWLESLPGKGARTDLK